MELTLSEKAYATLQADLIEARLLTGYDFAPVVTTELETMRGDFRTCYYRCKRCGMYAPGYSDAVGTHRPRYCSNCGARVVK